jgi:ribose transport system substrate-binding protein
MSSRFVRRHRLPAVGALVIAVALLASACGSDQKAASSKPAASSAGSRTSTDGVAEAQKIVDAALKEPPFVAPPSFAVAAAKGKTVWWLRGGGEDITTTWFNGAHKAFDSVGVNLKSYSIDAGTPDKIIAGLELAISSKADAIVIGTGVPATQFSEQIKTAADAGIPVFSAVNSIPGVKPDIPGLTADNTFDYEGAARLLAAWIVVDTGGKANVLTENYTAVAASQFMVPAFEKELARLSPNSKNKTIDVTPSGSNVSDAFATPVQTEILQNPGLNYVNPLYDFFITLVEPAIVDAGKSADIGQVGFNGIAPTLTQLKKGGSTARADVGQPNEWLGYAIADNVLRALTGKPTIDNLHIGIRLFTSDSVKNLDTSVENDLAWYGIDLATEYAKVWTK